LVLASVGIFYAWLLYLATRRFAQGGELAYGNVHV
jgi:uncharacterized membrane protein